MRISVQDGAVATVVYADSAHVAVEPDGDAGVSYSVRNFTAAPRIAPSSHPAVTLRLGPGRFG
jgi:hypothetical protein